MKPSMAIWQERKQLKDEIQLQQLRHQLGVEQALSPSEVPLEADLEGKGDGVTYLVVIDKS